MKIFYVNGIATSGKDAFLDHVEKYIDIARTSTVDRVKEIAAREFGWDGNKDEKGRKLLASLRYAWGEYNEGPIQEVRKLISICKAPVMFIMVREFEEMMKMKRFFGGETLLITRPGVTPCETEQKFLDEVPADYEYDTQVCNNGSLEDLRTSASKFVHNITLGQLI